MKPAAPKNEDDWLTDGIGIFISCCLIGIAILGGVYAAKFGMSNAPAHAECTLITVAPTGVQQYCGKACFHDLKTYTYQCPDGYHAEVR